MMKFEGKTAVVTGGSRGIGRAVCLELAAGGANVVLCYAGNEAASQETVKAVEAPVSYTHKTLPTIHLV